MNGKRVGQKKRGKYSRKPKKIILIGTEGNNQNRKKNILLLLIKLKVNIKINVAKGNNTDPEGVIHDLLKTAKQEELDLKQGDILACFIDVDFKKGREKELRAAIKLARQNNVSLYLSNPCFEVWYLLHFRYSTKPYCSNDEAIRDLNSYISDYSKSKDVFELIVGNSKQAIENSKKVGRLSSK